MKIKKYIANTFKEGKERIFADLGEEAVILSSRTAKNPTTGEDIIEIVAAVDEGASNTKTRPIRDKLLDVSTNNKPAKPNPNGTSLEGISQIFGEINELKDTLNEVRELVKYKHSGALGSFYKELYIKLIDAELGEELALKVISEISGKKNFTDFENILQYAGDKIFEGIKLSPPIEKNDKRKIFGFVGPTGCGKTTSIVKAAIACKLIFQADVLIITADTYKVGGIEQMQTFASVSGISFFPAYNPEELKSIIEKEHKRDFIFIDTTGRSQQNEEALLEIREYLLAARADYIYLVQSASSGAATFRQVIDKFGVIGPDALILSKIDETASIGSLIGELKSSGLPLAYLTNGQRIPEDIEPVTKDKLTEILFGNND